MKIVLTGATGFAGGEVLRQALADPEIEQITVLTRRALAVEHAKLRVVIVQNFEDYQGLALEDHAACIWCLGVSQAQVGKDAYIQITLDYAMAAARAMYAYNPQMRFCFLSGRGADPTEQASSRFAKIKGRTERQLAELGGPLFVFRPAYIRPTRASGPRKDFARWLAPIGNVMAWFSADLSVDCDQLAHAMLDVAKHGADHSLLTNSELRRW